MAFVGGCIARAGPKRGWWDAVGLFAVYVVALVAGALWSRSGENSTVLWTASGVLTAGLLLLRPRTGWAFVATRAIRVPASPSAVMPVLAVTADVMRDDVERRRAAGMNSHVPKPINPARLMTALMTVLDGGESFPTAAPAPVAVAA